MMHTVIYDILLFWDKLRRINRAPQVFTFFDPVAFKHTFFIISFLAFPCNNNIVNGNAHKFYYVAVNNDNKR